MAQVDTVISYLFAPSSQLPAASVHVMPASTLKLNSVVMKFLKPKPDAEEWESIVVGYEKVVHGPEVWFKIKYSSGWYSWCLGLIDQNLHALFM